MGIKNAVVFFLISLLSSSLLFSAIFTVVNVGDAGPGSLRNAIIQANTTVGHDTIEFNFGVTPGIKPITLLTVLPTITDTLLIDGSSDATYTGTPLIEINAASLTGLTENGLTIGFAAPHSHIRALIINNAPNSGISVDANYVKITGCYLGTNSSGTIAAPNASAGIEARNIKFLQVGGLGANDGNLISGNDSYGVRILFSDSLSFYGNRIGTDRSGLNAIGNGVNPPFSAFDGAGISAVISNVLTIGGNTVNHKNLISGNLAGINLTGNNSDIYGNFIGTDESGTNALPNTTGGIVMVGDSNNIGGVLVGEGNLISGNNFEGINMSTFNSFGNKIQGNLIGTNAAGTAALPNVTGIKISNGAELNLIGGLTPAARNLISGNTGTGIDFSSAVAPFTDSNYVYNNYIGTDINGTAALGNGGTGISITSAKNTFIGNATAAGANIIAASGTNGIQISGADADSTIIKQNYIGTDVTGLLNLSNNGRGIFISTGASFSEIGGTLAGEGNVIANNLQGGVEVNGLPTVENRILRNSIYDHPVVGIKLSSGNISQEAPVLSGFAAGPGNTTIFGTFNSLPNTTYRLEFFTSNTAGQGKTFIGTTTIVTDGTGAYALNEVVPVTITAAQPVITSTATDPNGNTSPFGVETVLSAEITDFSVEKLSFGSAMLTWEISDQEQSLYFEIEHQIAEGEFQKIGEQTNYISLGDTRSYEFDVNNLSSVVHTFRVIHVGQGGTRTYSKSIELDLSQSTPYQLLLANPVNSASSLRISLEQSQHTRIYLIDVNGKRLADIFSGEIEQGFFQEIPLQALENVSAGIHLLKIEGQFFNLSQKVLLK